MKPRHAWAVLWLAAALPLAYSLVALPVDFVPVEFKPDDGLLYPLAYDNGTQLGEGRSSCAAAALPPPEPPCTLAALRSHVQNSRQNETAWYAIVAVCSL